MIAALELDRRLRPRRPRRRLPRRDLPVTLLALAGGGAAGARRGAQRPRHRAAARGRRGGAACRALARLDRRAANRWLDAQVPPIPGPRAARTAARLRRSLDLLSDRSAVADGAPPDDPAAAGRRRCWSSRSRRCSCFALLPAARDRGAGGRGEVDYVGPWTLGAGRSACSCWRFALPAAALAARHAGDALPRAVRDHRTRCSSRAPPGGPVREMLAESLGDRSVTVAYWLPDREKFVDEQRPAGELPEPGLGAGVDRGGARRPAASRRSSTTRRWTRAASWWRPPRRPPRWRWTTSACGRTCRRGVEELRLSRLRIMEAGDAARRRIERNLHDGAQQQLVALALDLRMLKARLEGPGDRRALGAAGERAGGAARARARHPSRDPHRPRARARDHVARRPRRRCRSRPTWSVEERLPAPVEAAAYFLVAEALTNVARYAEASSARVEVRLRRRGARRARSPTTASAGWTRRSAAGCAGSTTASRRSAGRSRSTARSAAARGCRRGSRCRMSVASLGLCIALRGSLASPAAAAPSVVREPGVRGRPARRATAGRRAPARPVPDGAVRIAVVTHGPASSKFWAIIRNGVDSAARRLDVLVDYQSPDVYIVERMSELIDEAVATKPDGLVVSIPEPGLAPAIRRAVRAGIPVVSINSGSDSLQRLGVLAHVGQSRSRAGLEAGRRLARRGRAQRALHQPAGRQHRPRRALRGLARAMREVGGRARVLPIVDDDPRHARADRAAPSPPTSADGVLATNSRRRAGGGRGPAGRRIKIGTFDLGPDVLKAVQAGRIGFAVDQQAYLQGYLPIEMLALRARYGIFPSAGRRGRHGAELRHPRRRRAGARAERAVDSLGGWASWRAPRAARRERWSPQYLIAASPPAMPRRPATRSPSPCPTRGGRARSVPGPAGGDRRTARRSSPAVLVAAVLAPQAVLAGGPCGSRRSSCR